MKKFLVSLSLIVAFSFYALLASTRYGSQPLANSSAIPAQPIPSEPVSPVKNATSVVSNVPAKAPTIPAPTASQSTTVGAFKNGVYTGPVTNAYYGNVQVQATILGGKLTDVQFLQYPSDRRTSQQINSKATVQLKSEAIQAQSANVDMVSGATETSTAFKASLGGALALAKN